MIPSVRQKVAEYFEYKFDLSKCSYNPQEIVALGAGYLAFDLANPDQVRQVEFRQRVENVVTEQQKGHPILFGLTYHGSKF